MAVKFALLVVLCMLVDGSSVVGVRVQDGCDLMVLPSEIEMGFQNGLQNFTIPRDK